ncbi:MAG TPA: HAMP domain-containing sensor histidine kinase [Candidatus Dormibacteraeota bacterium]|nr:HAMP domain-containing sensor histidine kinase [Candidatus Dormibacteraeota bacterium]
MNQLSLRHPLGLATESAIAEPAAQGDGELPVWVVAARAVAIAAVTLGAAIGLTVLLEHTVQPRLPAYGLPFLVAVVITASVAGTRAALLVSAAATAYLGIHLAAPGELSWDRDSVYVLAAFAPAATAIALLVGIQQQRTERRYAKEYLREREHRERMAALEHVKSQFLNLASHELRGPLGLIRGYVSMIEEGSFGPLDATDMTRAAPVLTAKVSEMALLIDRMLDTARLEEHNLNLSLARVDLADITQRAVDTVAPLGTPNHSIIYTPPRRPVPVQGDAVRLGIIITNLLHNAVKYSPGGGVVQCFLGSNPDEAVLSVWDTGLGIAESDIPRLFERFGRLVTRENSHIPGTGLGLYLSRELARLHGGDITVRSTLGAGSVFTLTLPLDHSAAPTVRVSRAMQHAR